jgi:hypothetical protein
VSAARLREELLKQKDHNVLLLKLSQHRVIKKVNEDGTETRVTLRRVIQEEAAAAVKYIDDLLAEIEGKNDR